MAKTKKMKKKPVVSPVLTKVARTKRGSHIKNLNDHNIHAAMECVQSGRLFERKAVQYALFNPAGTYNTQGLSHSQPLAICFTHSQLTSYH